MILAETYIELMKNPAHLGAEATVTILENVVTILIARPIFKRWLKNHDAKKHAHEHCEDIHSQEETSSIEERIKFLESHSESWLRTHDKWVKKN